MRSEFERKRPIRDPCLTRQGRKVGLDFARQHGCLDNGEQCFSQENTGFCSLTKLVGYVCIDIQASYPATADQDVEKFGGGYVMVCSGISIDERT